MRAPSIIIGDWNLSADEVEQLAARVGGEFVVGHAPDHAILGPGVRLESLHRLPAHGSDHRPILLTVTVEGERLRILWWNVWVGQTPLSVLRAVCELVDAHQPHVVALGETYRCRDVLARVPGYRRRQSMSREGVELAVLVRRDLEILHAGIMHMLTWWIGPKHGKRHPPREFPRLRLVTPGGTMIRLLAVHLPTGGYTGRNATAVRESAQRIIRWAKT